MDRIDQEIRANILAQLTWDARADAADVTVNINNGQVTLSGSAPTYFARQAAEEDAWAIPGVVTVDNQLLIEYPPSAPSVTDAEIESRVDKVLDWNPNIDIRDLVVNVDNGFVALEGSVDAYWKKDIAEDLAFNVGGVIGIENKLAITPTNQVEDQLVGGEIVAALDRNPVVNEQDIDVEVVHGVVTLTGCVPSRATRKTVEDAAVFTRGVKDVDNRLTVAKATAQDRFNAAR